MENTTVPTLDELLAKYRELLQDAEMEQYNKSFLEVMHGVACGASQSILTGQSAQAAAQTVLVVYYHVKKEMESQ